MAAAKPSPLASSTETTNGAKLSRLLIDGGTTVLRNAFDNYHPPASLATDLSANYLTLDNLLRKRVIRQAQWDQLFPPKGAKPDSNCFDITLLFLLLTNICGLSPPLSGWHTKPPLSDTSFEANLARIKFFRNELYGHVSSTGVDTPTFKALWHEIGAVLLALGFDQAEIDRLLAERCGEDDYLDVLFQWTDSELDVISQLKVVRLSLSETQQDVKKVLQNKVQDCQTLKESISKLEEVRQIERETHQAVKDTRLTQLEHHKTLHYAMSKLNEIHKIENETHQVITETHQDTISKLEGVSHTQTKTCQAVEEVHDTLRAGLQEVKQEVEDLKRERERDKANELLRSLSKSEFTGDIEYHAQRFQEGTREWIFKTVENWLDDRTSSNRVMVISGNAGMGKSVISAVICKRMQNAGRLSGSHFCQHNNVRYRKPQLMLQSLASHLSYTLPEYKNALAEQLSRNLGMELNSMGVEELFSLLFKEPLGTVTDPGRNILMVIDGLDESEYQGRNELLDVIANKFFRLPQWIRFFVTTRPEINIADNLKHLQPIQLDENQEENLRDIRLFFEMRLSPKIAEEQKEVIFTRLVEKSEGVFLYAYFLIDHIQQNVPLLTLEQLKSSLPLGISSVYLSHFKRLENELRKELNMDENQVLNFLYAFTASREPIPVAFVSRLLSPGGKSLSTQRRVNKAISSISSLLPVRNDCLHFFHKSIKDWLTNTSCYRRHDFTVDEKEGHGILFHLCRNELDNIKRRGVHKSPFFSDTERYALQHGVQHMIELSESGESPRLCDVEELVNTYVTDLELIYAKLCVSSTGSSEDIFSVQKHIKSTLLSERSQSLLVALLKVLRKHSYLLRDHPQLWFQSLINDGPPELSSEAAAILENRLSTVPYMKYLSKQEENVALEARFYCSDTVACFDVSPEMDYMVCECRDGTIHLWSLETGNLEWSRPSLINREFKCVHPESDIVPDRGAYREIECEVLTFYRSVVFHPSGNSILPGTLRSVYTLEGDCNSLYPNSNCTFSHCVLPTDKRTILTDRVDDPKEVVLWSMESGQELRRIAWNYVITSFAISQDGSGIAFADETGSINIDVVKGRRWRLFKCDVACGLMHFTQDNQTIVCGYLSYMFEENIDYGLSGWVSYRNPAIILCQANKNNLPQVDFVLWPIEPKTKAMEYFCDDGWVKNVQSVFSSLVTGFYKWLDNGTALVGSPSFNYVAAIHVDSPSEANWAFTTQAVEEVVFSSEGDVIYSITSKDEGSVSAVQVTIFRMSSQELLVKKCFTCPSLSLVPMKEGVLLCLKHKVPELWNFQLTESIRQIPKLKGTEKLIRLSNELIACEWYCRIITPEELSDFGYPSETEDSQERYVKIGPMEEDEALYLDNFTDDETSDDSSTTDSSAEFNNFLIRRRNHLFFALFVDIVNVTSGECVSSIKTRDSHNDVYVFVSCNSQSQLLVCTREERNDGLFEGEQLTVSLRSNNSFPCIWKRKAARYDTRSFTPYFMFSPEEEFVVTWASFSSGYGVHILDAKTGKTQRTLLEDQDDIVDCKFVFNGHSLVCCSKDNFLRLFDIRFGDPLSVLDIEERPQCLGACLGKPLVAIGLSGARLKFVHVKLPSVQEAEGKKGNRTEQK